jgi:pimeloyl-ACP methyl ester carboxylesterase
MRIFFLTTSIYFFFFCCFLFFLFFFSIPFLLSFLQLFYLSFFHSSILTIWNSSFLSKESILQHEKDYRNQKSNHSIHEYWTQITDTMKIRDIYIQGTNGKTILLFHGTNTISTISWLPIILKLNQLGYSVIAPDIPSYGISDFDMNILDKSPCKILEYYEFIFDKYCKNRNIEKSIVIGHSFGGFLLSHFVSKHPEYFIHAIYVNPAGILPTLGKNGIYWGIFFKLGFISRLFYSYYGILTRIVYPLLNGSMDSQIYIRVLGNEENVGDSILSKFISYSYYFASWNHPNIQKILHSNIKISMIYGGNDNIMPPHNGILISALTDGKIPIYIIPKMGHCIIEENWDVFVKLLNEIIKNKKHKSNTLQIPEHMNRIVGSYFCGETTMEKITYFYQQLLSFRNNKNERIKIRIWENEKIRNMNIFEKDILTIDWNNI